MNAVQHAHRDQVTDAVSGSLLEDRETDSTSLGRSVTEPGGRPVAVMKAATR
jgi:hypothetical protein